MPIATRHERRVFADGIEHAVCIGYVVEIFVCMAGDSFCQCGFGSCAVLEVVEESVGVVGARNAMNGAKFAVFVGVCDDDGALRTDGDPRFAVVGNGAGA